ncbi:multiple epidermal growth factor-like domains protein 6 [Haliotis rufescens]|uniref:multiple epidermal growth factor-like domains protein 6 n=1 Tax=Haliotis rufescens TaxID=6454 RepID=UPI00201E8A16|nr:multiple epidermal growth factor-like domains protein 6 [Haliotis rufescens]
MPRAHPNIFQFVIELKKIETADRLSRRQIALGGAMSTHACVDRDRDARIERLKQQLATGRRSVIQFLDATYHDFCGDPMFCIRSTFHTRSTGICAQCHSPYTGPNCEMPCENCKGTCKAGCEGGCKPGFYGHWCDKVCGENCRAGLDATFELECDRNVSNTCILDCDKKTGHCIHGCNPGFYGHWCEKVCSENCLPDPNGTTSSACDRNGSNNCIRECDNNTGDCIHGCNVRWHGTNCSSRCNSKCRNLFCAE